MQAGGLDGIEVELYGHFADQFWSPATNQRDDEYGGSLENRMRFSLRMMEAMRKRVGSDFIIGVRMVADEDWDIGLSKEEGIEIARRLVATGDIDFINLIRGHIDSDVALTGVIPVQGMASGPHVDFCGEVRAATQFPILHAARIADVATARHAVSEGKLDLVGMTRAHIADPHIVNKIVSGREHEIRPCVGATYCLDRIYEGHEALCIHNPATGREAFMPHVIPAAEAANKKHVVVVGAGPAGLEAARVAAARGHKVTLLEAAAQAGGQVHLLSRMPRRREMAGIIDWRVSQCEKAGVDMRFDTFVEPDDVSALQPDVVVIATGGVPNTAILDDGNNLVNSGWEILSGDVKPGARVLVYDDNAAHAGLAAAEMLADSGAEVEIVTPERFFAADIGGLNHAAYAKVFARHGVRVTINSRLKRVARDGNQLSAMVGSDYAERTEQRSVDQVIVEHGTLPADELYFELKPLSRNLGELDYTALKHGRLQTISSNAEGSFQLFRIGDAVASRNIHAAIYDALRLVKDI